MCQETRKTKVSHDVCNENIMITGQGSGNKRQQKYRLRQVAFQWRIQDFPEEGALTPKGGGAPTYYLANFSRKLHENEEILDQRGGRASLAPPLRSATAFLLISKINTKQRLSVLYFCKFISMVS